MDRYERTGIYIPVHSSIMSSRTCSLGTCPLLYTVELQWLEHLWNHESMFETGIVRANECYSLRQVMRHNRDIFSIFFYMKVSCVFSLELPHRSNSNEYTQYTIFNINIKNRPKLSEICNYGIFLKGLMNNFETAMVNKPSVFEPLKFNCIVFLLFGYTF